MRRGEIWTMAGGADYAGKPRPVLIVQDDRFDATASVTICSFTTNPVEAPLFRLPVEPSEINGLHTPSRLIVDKITTVPREKLCRRLGSVEPDQMLRFNRAAIVFLGLAAPTKAAAGEAG